MKQLNLNFDKKPITEPTKKEDFTQKDFEKYITTRPSFKESNGAFQRLVDQQNHLNKLEKLGIEESQVKHPNYPKKKPDVINYIEKKREYFNDPIKEKIDPPILKNNLNSKRFVNKTLNKFENRTENKDVVTFDPTTQLFTDDTRNIAFKTYDQAKRWNDTVNGQPTATPKQVNDLDQRLKRNGFTKPIIEKKKKTTTVYPEVKVPTIDVNLFNRPPTPPEPQIPLRDQIKILADERLVREQRAWDQENGSGGIAEIFRPK